MHSIVPQRDLDPDALLENQSRLCAHIRTRLFSEFLPHVFRECVRIEDARAWFTLKGEFKVGITVSAFNSPWIITDLDILVRGVEGEGVPMILHERQIIDVIAIAQQKLTPKSDDALGQQPLKELYKYLRILPFLYISNLL